MILKQYKEIIMKNKYFLFATLLLLPLLSGCLYKMPNDDTLCTSPNTNNPHLTGEKAPSLFPAQG